MRVRRLSPLLFLPLLITGHTPAARAASYADELQNILLKFVESISPALQDSMAALPESEQLEMANLIRKTGSVAIFTAIAQPESVNRAYELMLRWKGRVFLQQYVLFDAVRSNPELAGRLRELQEASRQMSALVSVHSGGPQVGNLEVKIRDATEKWNEIERELARGTESYAKTNDILRVGLADIQRALSPRSALIDFAEYDDSGYRAEGEPVTRRFGAFVVRGEGPIRFVDLGSADEIEAVLDHFRERYGRKPHAIDIGDDPGPRLRDRLWTPLTGQLANVTTVFISPTGILGRVPFSALPGSRPGSYLIEDYAFAIVPVPQMLPKTLTTAASDASGLAIFGGVDFNAAPGKESKASQSKAVLSRPNGKFARLDSSAEEVHRIGKLFRDSHPDEPLDVRLGKDATEQALRTLAPTRRDLHLATHGFFSATGGSLAAAPAAKGSQEDAPASLPIPPSALSGIALAGANVGAAARGDDGIFRAIEIMGLDLHRTDLVVLSACEAALGQASTGEWLFGVQRALQVAGAKTAIASLWAVDDERTMEMMNGFYENLWSKGMGKLESLRAAQLQVLRAHGPSPTSVWTWGGWVVSGAP